MLGRTVAALTAAALIISTATFAETSENSTVPITNHAALSGGTAAGVKKAQSFTGGSQLLWVVGGGLIIGGIVMVATGNGHGATGTTCPLPGCPSGSTSTSTTAP
jgi:hypothetical protein